MDKIIKLIIWPVVVIIGMLIFKKPLLGIIAQIESIRYRNLEIKFREGLKKVEKTIKDKEGPELKATSPYMNLAKDHPISAVMNSWRDLEFAINEKVKSSGLPEMKNATKAINELFKNDLLDLEVKKALDELRNLRNQATHTPGFTLSYDDALAYAESAGTIAMRINKQ
ncbi:MAG: DUF4145 domain-containing protein [Candidatus Omnitrophica bacterium]|nr:DUF4145 domain-containing protein [Candidatus Omnitrophota bacterium]MDD5354984.1 DUF4145 domain-containing protein [Candidatus Omnitrophota bacterium]